jgi:hypothetical protein
MAELTGCRNDMISAMNESHVPHGLAITTALAKDDTHEEATDGT